MCWNVFEGFLLVIQFTHRRISSFIRGLGMKLHSYVSSVPRMNIHLRGLNSASWLSYPPHKFTTPNLCTL